MKHLGHFAFGVTTCVLLPTALHWLDGSHAIADVALDAVDVAPAEHPPLVVVQ